MVRLSRGVPRNKRLEPLWYSRQFMVRPADRPIRIDSLENFDARESFLRALDMFFGRDSFPSKYSIRLA